MKTAKQATATKSETLKSVTIIYYNDQSLELEYQYAELPQVNNGRVIVPEEFKVNRSIIAICEGSVNILNKLGERVVPFHPTIASNASNYITHQ